MSLKVCLHCVGMSKNDIVTITFDYHCQTQQNPPSPPRSPSSSPPHSFSPPHPSSSSLPTTTATHESVTQQDQQAATESEYKLPCMILNWDSIKLLICFAVSLEESPERSELMTAQENN